MIWTILVVLLILALLGGGWGYRSYGTMSWSPLLIILVVVLILYLAGVLR